MSAARTRASLATVIFVMAAAVPCPASGMAAQEPLRLLDVPYLPQTEALCGGAAAAMVIRYWDGSTIYADTFSHLVDAGSGGIRGDDLLTDLRSRGWQAVSFRGDATIVAGHLAKGRPLIALIEDRPNRFHYVVIVGWAGKEVIAHDPARAPFRVLHQDAFLAAWSKSDFWTLLALPSAPAPQAGGHVEPPPRAATTSSSCGAMVGEGIRLAGAGGVAEAKSLLQLAVLACPGDAAPLRELAGVHVLGREWSTAARYAGDALTRDPGDAHSARILATSRFVLDDPIGALEVWNRFGEPVVDLVNVAGLARTRYDVVARLLDVQPRELLTPATIGRARRRLSELPAAAVTRVAFAPQGGGRANLEATMVERPIVPYGVVAIAILGVRAVTDREATATISGASGGGETLTASWRWWERRPRVAISFKTPAPPYLPGAAWRVDAFYDRQTYFTDAEIEETRRGGELAIADWLTESWRWEIGSGLSHWSDRGTAAVVSVALERRSASDNWIAAGKSSVHFGGLRTGTLAAGFEWRSHARLAGSVWHGRIGADAAGRSAPFALWPGAGTGPARGALLRAHPMLEDGVIREAVFGRTLVHGGGEWRYWIQPGARPLRLAPAVFVDLARASRTLDGFDSRLHVDAGVGLRISVIGAGTLRVDLGRGLRDGEMAVSFGWTR